VRKGAVAMMVALVVVATSCGSSSPPPSPKRQFLDEVAASGAQERHKLTDAELLTLGNAVCSALQVGTPLQAIGQRFQFTFGNSQAAEDVAIIGVAAVRHLCPQYSSELQ